jgi:hypothetical protein
MSYLRVRLSAWTWMVPQVQEHGVAGRLTCAVLRVCKQYMQREREKGCTMCQALIIA